MKINNNIAALLAGIAFLTSCSDDVAPTYTVGEADNAIVLRAGISEGGAGVQTRAAGGVQTRAGAAGGYDDIDEANHGKHLAFTNGTKAALRIDGDWWKQDATSATSITKTTTATIGAETATDSKHNTLTMSPQLYWDDYGTADPANAGDGKGRKKGLTIYGAAVNGETTAPTVSDWTALAWNVGTPTGTPAALDQTSGWAAKDLLTSNNVKVGGLDDTYKFDEKSSGKLLEFTHAMSKVTVNLTAGEGFPGYTSDHHEYAKFQQAPKVTLLQFYYTGTYNIESKTPTATTTSKTDIKACINDGATWASAHTAQATALVFPGNSFGDATDILKIDADGNIYYVNAAKINAAMTTTQSNTTFTQAKNYVLNITVNKTSIDVTATIKQWEDVTSENEAPIIGFSQCYGQTTGTGMSNFGKGFTFYRSTSADGSYLVDGNSATVTYEDSKYKMTPQLFWPDHSTHYFFRGIWPEVKAEGTPVEKVEANGIVVENCDYAENTYPTDLMIGMPRQADGTSDEFCKAGHTTGDGPTPGICATDAVSVAHPNEGLIHMNFQYAMSKVIVKLTTNETSGAKDKVTFDEHTKVEIVDCYTGGKIKLGDGSSDFTGKSVTNYTMNKDNGITNPVANQHANYRNVVIPQSLSNTVGSVTKDLKFRITVGDGTTTDVYETVLGIKNIKVSENGGTADFITAWQPGKRYTYTLYITKTDIKVTATLTDWKDVTASEEIWF